MRRFHSPRSRWSAAVSHFLLSLLVIGSVAGFAFLHWYPAGLHHAAKLDKLMGIMLAVDIVAGPVLTLILYRIGKRGLKFDLAAVAMLQLAFLAYGLNTLWQSRPLFLVGSQQAFALIFAPDVPPGAADRARKEQWPRFQGSGPWLVAVDLSSDVAREEFLFSYMAGSPGPLGDADLFVPYDRLRQEIVDGARALAEDVPTPDHIDRSQRRSLALLSPRAKATAVLLGVATGQPEQVVALLPPSPKNSRN